MAKYKLMKHQKKAVKFLDSVDGIGALLMDPGTGKTGSTLAWIDKQAKTGRDFRVLVVAPKTAADTWVLQTPLFMDSPVKARFLEGSTVSILGKIKDSASWENVPDTDVQANFPGTAAGILDGGRVTVLSLSAGALSSFCTTRANVVQALRAIRDYAPDLVVIDESHIIKSHDSNLSQVMHQIGALAEHRVILTGTVQPHSPLDIYGQWRFLAPWTFSESSHKAFTRHPHKMTEEQKNEAKMWGFERFKSRYTMTGGRSGKEVVRFQRLDDLNGRVAERAFVVRKEDALDLPPTQDIDIHVSFTARERKAYDEMRKDLATQLASGEILEAVNALAKIMKLRQIASGFVKDTESGEVHSIGTSIQQAVKEVVNVQLAGENRVVVFAYFRAECAELAKALAMKGRTVELITGQTPSSERLAIRKRFGDVSGNPEPIVLVAQARTMSLSVNELVTAQHAVYASMSERRDDWVQSRGRLDRNGQTKPVTFWNCFVPGTVGEIMRDTHKERGNLEDALLSHIKGAFK